MQDKSGMVEFDVIVDFWMRSSQGEQPLMTRQRRASHLLAILTMCSSITGYWRIQPHDQQIIAGAGHHWPGHQL